MKWVQRQLVESKGKGTHTHTHRRVVDVCVQVGSKDDACPT